MLRMCFSRYILLKEIFFLLTYQVHGSAVAQITGAKPPTRPRVCFCTTIHPIVPRDVKTDATGSTAANRWLAVTGMTQSVMEVQHRNGSGDAGILCFRDPGPLMTSMYLEQSLSKRATPPRPPLLSPERRALSPERKEEWGWVQWRLGLPPGHFHQAIENNSTNRTAPLDAITLDYTSCVVQTSSDRKTHRPETNVLLLAIFHIRIDVAYIITKYQPVSASTRSRTSVCQKNKKKRKQPRGSTGG